MGTTTNDGLLLDYVISLAAKQRSLESGGSADAHGRALPGSSTACRSSEFGHVCPQFTGRGRREHMETGASVWTHAPAQPRQRKRDHRRRQGRRRVKWRINSRNNASVLQRATRRDKCGCWYGEREDEGEEGEGGGGGGRGVRRDAEGTMWTR